MVRNANHVTAKDCSAFLKAAESSNLRAATVVIDALARLQHQVAISELPTRELVGVDDSGDAVAF